MSSLFLVNLLENAVGSAGPYVGTFSLATVGWAAPISRAIAIYNIQFRVQPFILKDETIFW